jgi:hypothetical protein
VALRQCATVASPVEKERTVNRCFAVLFAFFVLVSSYASPARAGEEETKRDQDAVRVLMEVMLAPDKRIPADLFGIA